MKNIPIFDATQFSGKPAAAQMFAKYRFQAALVPSAAITCTPTVNGVRWPDAGAIQQVASQAKTTGSILILDMDDANSPDQLRMAIEMVRTFAPAVKLGAYGVGPALGPAALQAAQYTYKLASWWRLQQPYAEIVDRLDMVCPSLYSTGDADADARVAAVALTFAASRWPRKFILPFLSNRVAGNAGAAMVSHDCTWNLLQVCSDCADGAVLWTNPGEIWSPSDDLIVCSEIFAGDQGVTLTAGLREFLGVV